MVSELERAIEKAGLKKIDTIIGNDIGILLRSAYTTNIEDDNITIMIPNSNDEPQMFVFRIFTNVISCSKCYMNGRTARFSIPRIMKTSKSFQIMSICYEMNIIHGHQELIESAYEMTVDIYVTIQDINNIFASIDTIISMLYLIGNVIISEHSYRKFKSDDKP